MCTLVCVYLSVVKEHLGLHEFLCAWKCVLCVVMGVCPKACRWYLLVQYASCISVCVLCVCVHKYMHIGGRIMREKILDRLSD